jgi:protein phosphatase
VKAARIYYESVKPFLKDETATGPALTAQQQQDDILDLRDVTGKLLIETRLMRNITIREENSITALEVMSRFAADPKWLIYLPPTMSPSETNKEDSFLEHPTEAFEYFRNQNVEKVICEEKHMGSRACLIVCRDEATARKRFGVVDDGVGICYTRAGRRFFDDRNLETSFIERVVRALDQSNLWEEFKTDWFALDCELMPWSAKAQELLKQQYAAVGSSARASLNESVKVLEQASTNGVDVSSLLARFKMREEAARKYVDAYRRYCWTVHSLDDLKLAPFHILASEDAVHFDKSHAWQMETLRRLCAADDGLLFVTNYKVIDVSDEASLKEGIDWWLELTTRGGEGMVVKPFDFIVKGSRGLVQPAVKCRGREYLRIIYGPEYDAPENLERLRRRGLSAKRSLALREFALGLEALERFVRREPLRRVHECVFGVLALESEPVDPRL